MIKTNKKTGKGGIFSRRTHVDVTWHSGLCGSTTRAHTVPTRRDVTCIFVYRNYMGYSTYKNSVFVIYANLYFQHTLYTCMFLLIFSVWD